MVDRRVLDKPVGHATWGPLRALNEWLKPANAVSPSPFEPERAGSRGRVRSLPKPTLETTVNTTLTESLAVARFEPRLYGEPIVDERGVSATWYRAAFLHPGHP